MIFNPLFHYEKLDSIDAQHAHKIFILCCRNPQTPRICLILKFWDTKICCCWLDTGGTLPLWTLAGHWLVKNRRNSEYKGILKRLHLVDYRVLIFSVVL